MSLRTKWRFEFRIREALALTRYAIQESDSSFENRFLSSNRFLMATFHEASFLSQLVAPKRLIIKNCLLLFISHFQKNRRCCSRLPKRMQSGDIRPIRGLPQWNSRKQNKSLKKPSQNIIETAFFYYLYLLLINIF